MKSVIFSLGIVFLITLEFLRVYFIMPFPGSQSSNTLSIAYWIHSQIHWLRWVGWLAVAGSLFFITKSDNKKALYLSGAAILLYGLVFYFFNFRMLAEKMFIQPKEKLFTDNADNSVGLNKLAIGVTLNGQSKAYPIQIIGYHHQVRDTVGNVPVMITYCTVCRTGRVFSPVVNDTADDFRLVGMDHFNAMFEDSRTGSWWRQATGEAVAGPLKGHFLTEIPSQQTSIGAWVSANPSTLIMQYDPSFTKKYEKLEKFDDGTVESGLEKRDAASWKFKSWVVGISSSHQAKAYDWNELVTQKFIQDSIPGLALMLVLEKDSTSFHAFNRTLGTQAISFEWLNDQQQLRDTLTGSIWNLRGECISGPLAGTQLDRLQAYQEFWHSWQSFHPNSDRYPRD